MNNHLSTSTGKYDLRKIKSIAKAIRNRLFGGWFSVEDVFQDMLCELLSGKKLGSVFHSLYEKYRQENAVYMTDLSDEDLNLAQECHETTQRDKLEHTRRVKEFYNRINDLSQLNQEIMLLKLTGVKGKDIAHTCGISHDDVRVRIHRCIQEMKKG